MTRRGDWMQTYSGRQFWPLDPCSSDVDITDIAHSLALQCRFAGHCRVPYSVAEHSVRVAMLVREWLHMDATDPAPRRWVLAALLHDAAEAYLVDLPRPVKRCVQGYAEAEAHLETVIAVRFDLPHDPALGALIKRADNVLLATEARDLLGPHPAPWAGLPEPLPRLIHPWPWTFAEKRFLEVFAEVAT